MADTVLAESVLAMREFDWAATPLGSRENWPPSLRSLFEICLNSAAPIAIFWGSGHILLCNGAWSALVGEGRSAGARFGGCGRPAREIWPETWSRLGPILASVFERGEGARVPRDCFLRGGSSPLGGSHAQLSCDVVLSPIPGDDGGPSAGGIAGILALLAGPSPAMSGQSRPGFLRSLAERAATAVGSAVGAAYAHRKQRRWEPGRQAVMDVALNRVHEAVYLIDADARFIYVNDEVVRTLGYSRGELLGMGVPDIDPSVTIERWREMWTTSWLSSGKQSGFISTREPFETQHVAKDGRVFPVEISATLVEHDGVVYALSLVRDITERKRAEQKSLEHMRLLRLSEERYRSIVEATSVIVWVTAPDGKVLEDNPGWRAFSGQTLEEALGDGWLEVIHPDHRAGAIATWARAIETRKPFQAPCRMRRHDGEYRNMLVSGAPVLEKDGSVREWIGAYADITDRVRAKKEAERYRKNLEAEIIERQRAEAALFQAQKMEAIGQLTGGVAHDFNNLLTAITGNLDLLRNRLPKDEAVQRYARNALAAVERATGITSQLLAFSRSQRLESRAIDVNETVRGMLGIFRQTLGERIELEHELAPGLRLAQADRHQLETALLNLVINARDAMAEGGVLTIRTANLEHAPDSPLPAAPALPSELAFGRYVALTVSDTGHGVPPELASRIFEPFVTTKQVGKGTGLGLAMVYGFAKQSGGCVSLESEPGRGAAFSIYLPCARAAASPENVKKAERSREELSGEGTILVVEDEKHVREMATLALTSFGYNVAEAEDAVEAVAILEKRSDIDMVFTDLVMPRGNGVDLARTIRLRWPRLAILLTTGYTQSRAETELPPGVEVLMKPYRPTQLAEKALALLGRMRSRPKDGDDSAGLAEEDERVEANTGEQGDGDEANIAHTE